MKYGKLITAMVMAGAMALAGAASAGVLTYGWDGAVDTYQNGWAQGSWRVSVYTADFYDGVNCLTNSNNGQINVQYGTGSPGVDMSGEVDPAGKLWIEGYVNTTMDVASMLRLHLSYTGHGDIRFDARNIPTKYLLSPDDDPANAVELSATSNGIDIDADSSTWQYLKIDLTQTCYTGWPYTPHTYDPATMLLLRYVLYGNTNLLADKITLVGAVEEPPPAPIAEPATALLLGLGGIAALLRRRRS